MSKHKAGLIQTIYSEPYTWHVQHLLDGRSKKEAMSLAIGGEFEQFGALMTWLLIDEGLQPDHFVIDVGCGSGRLAKPLSEYLRGGYLGTDVVPGLLIHAKTICKRPDWRFELVEDMSIPAPDESADMVCCFSVFTHLLHEDSYRYLAEARRVLRPGGKVVFSFLEFRVPPTWTVFENMVRVRETGGKKPHDQFLSRDAIEAWSSHLGFAIRNIYDGHIPHVRLRHPLIMDDGRVFTDKASLGQSVGVLVKL